MEFSTAYKLTTENILSYLHPLDIFKRYASYFKRKDVKFKSEFRKDPNPSAIINKYKDTYLYKDFGEYGASNCFQFVGRKLGISFMDVLSQINHDFNLGLESTNTGPMKPCIYKPRSIISHDYKTIIKVKRRKFETHDLKWWYEQSWLLSMLQAAKISPISHYRLTSEKKGIYDRLHVCDKYTYSMDYYWNKGIFRRKIYAPKEPAYRKWVSNVDNTVVQGWDLLPKHGDIVFISSSFKDIGPFWRLFNFPVAIAPNSESSFIPNEVFWSKIHKNFKHKIIYFDNDNSGIKKAKQFSQIYKIPYIHNPLRAPKDPSDTWRLDNGRTFRNILKNELEKFNIITNI